MRQSKTTKKAKGKSKAQVRDLKPTKDAKGGGTVFTRSRQRALNLRER